MNWPHLSAFIWLRYRLRVNQLKRSGIVNQVLLSLLAIVTVAAVIGGFFGGLLVGLFAFRQAEPVVRLWVWDGLIVAFLITWMTGLLTELQRTDALALDRFLHLPVSPLGAFLINYVSSLFGLTMALFVPGMVGLILGQAIADGPQMLLALPLLAAFLLAVTALTYQFQGWLATLMTNPRRRRSVIVMLTMSLVLVGQLPNLVNVVRPWKKDLSGAARHNALMQHSDRGMELIDLLQSRQIDLEEYKRRRAQVDEEYQAALKQSEAQAKQSDEASWEEAKWTTRILNTAIPPAWLALGAADLAEGAYLPTLLGGLGLSLVGVLSLRRAYRTTLRIYSGYDSGGQNRKTTPEVKKTEAATGVRLIEWQLPGLPEQPAAVAVAAFRSTLRAPEAKMAMILPLVIVLILGAVVLAQGVSPPRAFRPLIAFGAMAMVLVCAVQLVGNQFGYDRAGFRAYVLSPIPRRDILLGKNMAVAPIALTLILVILVALECFCPMRIDHFLMAIAQGVAMFLLFCLLANGTSILAPIPIKPGGMQASQVKLTPLLAHFALMFLFPLVYAPLLIPYGIEMLLSEVTDIPVLPIALPLMLGLLVAVALIYRSGLNLLGRLLTNCEQKILEIVTSKSE